MRNDDERWFDGLPEEDQVVVRGMHRLHVNANLRTQLVAMLLLATPILVRHFYPEPWTVWATVAALCWSVGLFIAGMWV